MLGVPPERVFEALEVYLGSTFVNDFNDLGRTFRVTAQADGEYRDTPRDVENLRVRSDSSRPGFCRRGSGRMLGMGIVLLG